MMPSKSGKIASQVRLDEIAYKKMKVIAEREGRSANAQLDFFMRRCVAEYEKIHGPITVTSESVE